MGNTLSALTGMIVKNAEDVVNEKAKEHVIVRITIANCR